MNSKNRKTVEPEWVGKRLDRVVCDHLMTDLSRSRIQQLISNGDIKVNNKQIKPSFKLNEDDEIVYCEPDPEPSELIPEDIPVEIIHEDSSIVVVNKPRGMVVHPGAGIQSGTLVHALLWHCKDLSGIGGVTRPGIVHRIDRGTSGILVVAKNDQAHNHLASQFANRTIQKEYAAVIAGKPSWLEETVEQPIARHPNQRIRMAVNTRGKASKTLFKLVAYSDGGSLVLAMPKTGRTHQIRVHLEHLKHPILGDHQYGTDLRFDTPGVIKKAVKAVNGFCLHARSIHFRHPKTDKNITLELSIPDDMVNVLNLLELENVQDVDWKDFV